MPSEIFPKSLKVDVKKANVREMSEEIAKSKILERALDVMRAQPGFDVDSAVFDLDFGLHV